MHVEGLRKGRINLQLEAMGSQWHTAHCMESAANTPWAAVRVHTYWDMIGSEAS